MWEYRARLARVVDGNTVDLHIDLGFGVVSRQRVHLAGVAQPDRGAAGNNVSGFVSEWFARHEAADPSSRYPVRIRADRSDPRDKWGRYVVEVVGSDNTTLNQAVIDSGLATPGETAP